MCRGCRRVRRRSETAHVLKFDQSGIEERDGTDSAEILSILGSHYRDELAASAGQCLFARYLADFSVWLSSAADLTRSAGIPSW